MLSILIWPLIALLITSCAVNPNGSARHSAWYETADNTEIKPTLEKPKANKCPYNYKIVPGDTLSGIALKCQIDMAQLAKLNHLEPPYRLTAGQILFVPQAGEAPSLLGDEEGHNGVEALQNTAPVNWVWPMADAVPFTYTLDSSGRTGLSFFPDIGLPVFAVDDGRVAYAGDDLPHYGNLVVLKHDNGYVTVYAYNHVLEVTKDQRVKAGDVIARAGQSGDAQKPELYFEVRYLGRKVNAKGLFKAH